MTLCGQRWSKPKSHTGASWTDVPTFKNLDEWKKCSECNELLKTKGIRPSPSKLKSKKVKSKKSKKTNDLPKAVQSKTIKKCKNGKMLKT